MNAAPAVVADNEVDSPFPPRYWWLKRILLAVAVLLVCLVAVRWWWGVVAERRLNALIAEYKAAGEPLYPEDFQTPPVDADENAVTLILEAGRRIREPTELMISIDDALDPWTALEYPHEVRRLF